MHNVKCNLIFLRIGYKLHAFLVLHASIPKASGKSIGYFIEK